MSPDAPRVAVCLLTYNHERYIAQAIESVLMQETDFPVELVIGEDCSTDGTRAICERYARAHPDRIRLLPAMCNLGMGANARRTLEACRGSYIAYLEGDDYWTDPRKLQMQVECLEKDASLSLVYHNVEYKFEGAGGKNTLAFPAAGQGGLLPIPPPVTCSRDILKGRVIPSLSFVYRAAFLPEYPGWISGLPAGDWPFFLVLLQRGPGLYMDRVMAVYRQHAGGEWSSLDPVQMTKKYVQGARVVARHIPMGADDRRELHHGVWIRVLHCAEKQIRSRRPGPALSVLLDYAWRFPRQAWVNLYCYKLVAKALRQTIGLFC